MQHPSNTTAKKREKMIDDIIKDSVCVERSFDNGNEILQMTVTIEKFAELYDLMSGYAFSEHGGLREKFKTDAYICVTIADIAVSARWVPEKDWVSRTEDTYATFRRAFPTVIKNGVDTHFEDTFPSWIKKKAKKVMDLEIGEFDELPNGVTDTEFRSKFLNLMAQIAPNKILVFTVKAE